MKGSISIATYQARNYACEPKAITRLAIEIIKDILDNGINQNYNRKRDGPWPQKLISRIHDTCNNRIDKRLFKDIRSFYLIHLKMQIFFFAVVIASMKNIMKRVLNRDSGYVGDL